LLAAHSERVLAGANAMLRLINSPGGQQAGCCRAGRGNQHERGERGPDQGDLMTMLHKSFVTPLNRDQVYALTLDIDRVMNAVQDVAQAVGIYNITEVNAESRELASMAVEACSRLTRAIAALKERERSEDDGQPLRRNRAHRREVRSGHATAIKALFELRAMIVRPCGRWACGSSMRCRRRFCVASKASAQMLEEILIQNA
jgi:hypothetical protein